MIEYFKVLPFGEWLVSSTIFYLVVVTLLIVIGFAVAAFLNVVRYGPLEAFDRFELRRRPPRFVPSQPAAEPSELAAAGAGLDPEAEAIILTRLRALGYVE